MVLQTRPRTICGAALLGLFLFAAGTVLIIRFSVERPLPGSKPNLGVGVSSREETGATPTPVTAREITSPGTDDVAGFIELMPVKPAAVDLDLVGWLEERSLDEQREDVYEIAADERASREHRALLRALACEESAADSLRGLAVWGLAQIGELEAAVEALAPANPQPLRCTGARMLGRHGTEEELHSLVELASSCGDRVLRETSLHVLWERGHSQALSLLEAIAHDDDPLLRNASLEILGRTRSEESLALLVAHDTASSEREVLSQAQALFALREIDTTLVEKTLLRLTQYASIPQKARDTIEQLAQRVDEPPPPTPPCGKIH